MYLNTTKQAVAGGLVTENDIDKACRNILSAKYDLGLFSDPYRGASPERIAEIAGRDPEFVALAREAATKSAVLLKYDGQTLPLAKNQTIALIGPLANDSLNINGTWTPTCDLSRSVGVLAGMREVAGQEARILYARGANITEDPEEIRKLNEFGPMVVNDPRPPQEMIDDAVDIAKRSDTVVLVVGEGKEHTGEASSRTDICIPGRQRAMIEAVLAVGKPTVLVVMSGRPLDLSWEDANIPNIIWAPLRRFAGRHGAGGHTVWQ